MNGNITDIEQAKAKKRQETGWSLEEIREGIQKQRKAYKGLGDKEPDNLASGGDMKNILDEKEEDDQ